MAAASMVEDDHHLHHESTLGVVSEVNSVTNQDRKDQAILALKVDLMARLGKEVKSLDEDSWMFDGPRSEIHLISRPGGMINRQDTLK